MKRTSDGKTKVLVEKTDKLTGWLRIERRGKLISAYSRKDEKSTWNKVGDNTFDWLNGE